MNLVSPVADLTCDIKKEVKTAALECMTAICNCTGNKDSRIRNGWSGMQDVLFSFSISKTRNVR